MAKETLALFGTAVSCAQCLSLITNGLKSLDGVNNVSVDARANTLIIEFAAGAIDEAGIRARLRSLGFTGHDLYCIC